MNATVSRDVILDLLPAYLSGEVSADTRTLVETYLKQDPELAARIKNESQTVLSQPLPKALSTDRELAALRKTKRLLRRRTWFLVGAIFASLCQVSYQFGPEGFKWTWQDAPWAAALCGMIGILFWILYFRSRQRLRVTGV